MMCFGMAPPRGARGNIGRQERCMENAIFGVIFGSTVFRGQWKYVDVLFGFSLQELLR